jgi:hypothetical protein
MRPQRKVGRVSRPHHRAGAPDSSVPFVGVLALRGVRVCWILRVCRSLDHVRLAVTSNGQDMGHDAVEKPVIVAGDDGTVAAVRDHDAHSQPRRWIGLQWF